VLFVGGMFEHSPQTNVSRFLSPVVNGKQDAVRKHFIRPSRAKDQTNAQNMDKLEHFDPY